MGATKQMLMEQWEKEDELKTEECIRCGELFDPFPGMTEESERRELLKLSKKERELIGYDRNCCDYCEHVASKDD